LWFGRSSACYRRNLSWARKVARDGGTTFDNARRACPRDGRRSPDRSADRALCHDLTPCSSARIPRRVSSTSAIQITRRAVLPRKPTSILVHQIARRRECACGRGLSRVRSSRVYVHVVGWARGFRSAPHRYAHTLPGLRNGGTPLGYAVAFPETSKLLAQRRLAMGVNIVAARAAAAALADQAYLKKIVDRVTDDRQEFYNQANARMLRSSTPSPTS